MDADWEVADGDILPDGRIKVINRKISKGKYVKAEDLQRWQEVGFSTGQKVYFNNPQTQQVEFGWQVNEFGADQQVVQLINKKTKQQVLVDSADLQEWNNATTFLPGHEVIYTDSNNLPWPGWQITEIDPQTKQATIYNKTVKKKLEIPLTTLSKNLNPGEERYKKIKEVRK